MLSSYFILHSEKQISAIMKTLYSVAMTKLDVFDSWLRTHFLIGFVYDKYLTCIGDQ